MLAIEKYAGQSDAQSKGIVLSRFDAHLPVCCRDSKDLDAMVATLIYTVGMMLKYEQHLSKAKKTYLRSVRRAGEDVASGRDFRLIDKLLAEGTGVWDACWKIYFDLSQQLGEEDENFLGQAFHYQTSSHSYEEIRFVWKKSATKDDRSNAGKKIRKERQSIATEQASSRSLQDEMIEEAQKAMFEKDRLGQLYQDPGDVHEASFDEGIE
jgi:hypothetical protein